MAQNHGRMYLQGYGSFDVHGTSDALAVKLTLSTTVAEVLSLHVEYVGNLCNMSVQTSFQRSRAILSSAGTVQRCPENSANKRMYDCPSTSTSRAIFPHSSNQSRWHHCNAVSRTPIYRLVLASQRYRGSQRRRAGFSSASDSILSGWWCMPLRRPTTSAPT